jgi:Xaa-Pro dipeptidase
MIVVSVPILMNDRPPAAEREARYQRLREATADHSLDALLLYAAGWRREYVRYVTGARLQASFALALLPLSADAVAFVASEEDRHAVEEAGWVADVRPIWPLQLNSLRPLHRVGIAHLELMPEALLREIERALPGAELTSATGLVDAVQRVKSPWELEQIRRAARVCEAGWEAFVQALAPGVPEYAVVAAVEYELKRLGAEDNFMLIASGGREVMGMTPPGERRLQAGDMVRTELTPQVNGYWCQICRTAVVGEPDAEQRRSSELFLEDLEAGLAAVRAGVTAHEVARAENDVFRRHGYGEYCTSRYTRVRGHGHGLHPDETPSIVEGDHTVLEENSVVIVHPNTYTPLAGYHVLGDPVVVTAQGFEPLLTTERRLFEVAS